MSYKCSSHTYAGIGRTKGTWLFGVMGCKKWACPTCGKRKARAFSRGLGKFAVKNHARVLMTLTLDPKKCSADESCDYIKNVWRKFRVYLERKIQKKIKWVWVLEFQKNGYAHLHVVTDTGLSQKWVSKTWDKLGGGRIVDLRIVGEERIGAYLSKYLSKGFADALFKKFQRRYGAVRGAELFEKSNFKSLFTFTQPLESIIEKNRALLVSVGCGLDGILSYAEFSEWPDKPPF